MITSSHTTAQYMKQIGFKKKAYVIGRQVLGDELTAAGIEVVGMGPDVMDQPLQAHVMSVLPKMDKEVGAVIVGFDDHFSFPKLFKAVNYLRNPETILIASNNDQKVDFPNFTFPDAGPLIAAIENATGRKTTVVGKPSKVLADIALKQEEHRDRKRFLMIGDRLNTDVLFGNNNGFQTLLVGTGEHNLSDVKEVIEKIKSGEGDENMEKLVPDYYISALKLLFKN
jgi:phosphoglycolate phosphatase